MHLLRDGGTAIELAGDLTGLVSSNPVESVQRGRLGPALLQLAAFLLVFFVCKGARFGRPTAIRKHRNGGRFAEHVRALGLHYARARGERLALGFLGSYASRSPARAVAACAWIAVCPVWPRRWPRAPAVPWAR